MPSCHSTRFVEKRTSILARSASGLEWVGQQRYWRVPRGWPVAAVKAGKMGGSPKVIAQRVIDEVALAISVRVGQGIGGKWYDIRPAGLPPGRALERQLAARE